MGRDGPRVPVIGQGTWNLETDRRAAIRALRAGLDAGATHIDTAEMYGDGTVEELVGEAIDGRRDEVFLVSKVLPENASRRGTVAACERSLRRLGTERLDLYLLHWFGSHPLEETVSAFGELVETGKIRSWGVSNFDEVRLARLLEVPGGGAVACNQVLHHLRERSVEHAVIPFCRERGIAVVGYSPLGAGDFVGEGEPGRDLLEEIGARHGASPQQVALAFLVREDGTFTIPRTGDPDHARDNAAAGDLELSADEVEAIDRAFPRGPRRPGVPTL